MSKSLSGALLVCLLGAGCGPGTGSLSGSVTVSGAVDLAGIPVEVTRVQAAGEVRPAVTGTTMTDAQGRWEFRDLADGTYRVRITPAAAWEPTSETTVEVDGDTRVSTAQFQGRGRVRGAVRQHEGCGDSVVVAVEGAQTPEESLLRASASLNRNDTGFILDAPAGTQHLELRGQASGQAQRVEVVVPHGGEVDVGTVQLGAPSAGGTVQGTVSATCGGRSPEGAAVNLILVGICTLKTRSDAQGHYVFTHVPTGPFTIEAEATPLPGGVARPGGTVQAGATTVVDLTATGWGQAKGTARYADDRTDRSGIQVAINNATSDFPSAVTDAEGSYTLRTTCGVNRVCVRGGTPDMSPCVDVDVPLDGVGTAASVLVKP